MGRVFFLVKKVGGSIFEACLLAPLFIQYIYVEIYDIYIYIYIHIYKIYNKQKKLKKKKRDV